LKTSSIIDGRGGVDKLLLVSGEGLTNYYGCDIMINYETYMDIQRTSEQQGSCSRGTPRPSRYFLLGSNQSCAMWKWLYFYWFQPTAIGLSCGLRKRGRPNPRRVNNKTQMRQSEMCQSRSSFNRNQARQYTRHDKQKTPQIWRKSFLVKIKRNFCTIYSAVRKSTRNICLSCLSFKCIRSNYQRCLLWPNMEASQ